MFHTWGLGSAISRTLAADKTNAARETPGRVRALEFGGGRVD